jgi:hypothetical protein
VPSGVWVRVPPGLPSLMRHKREKEIRPGNGVECTCYDNDDVDHCEKRWYCCDCGREMMHRYGDLLGRCWQCNSDLDAKF